jgi:hypothetical protein
VQSDDSFLNVQNRGSRQVEDGRRSLTAEPELEHVIQLKLEKPTFLALLSFPDIVQIRSFGSGIIEGRKE